MRILECLLTLAVFYAASAYSAPKPLPALIAIGPGFSTDCGLIFAPPTRFEKYGPRYVFKSDAATPGKKKISERGRLKIMSYNMKQLSEQTGKFLGENTKFTLVNGRPVFKYGALQKSEEVIAAIVRNIESENPDVIIGIEIGSLHAMQSAFGSRYFMFLVPSVETSSVYIGYMVKREIAVDIEVQSFQFLKHEYLGVSERAFPHDFPVVSFRDPGASPNADPLLIFGGTHLKAPKAHAKKASGEVPVQRMNDEAVRVRDEARDRAQYLSQVDPNSSVKRTRQVESMIGVLKEYDSRYRGRVPFLIAGDFNADVRNGAEFNPFQGNGWEEVFRTKKLDPGDPDVVSTFSYFPGIPSKPGEEVRPPVQGTYPQIDAFFVHGSTTDLVSDTHVVPEVGPDGKVLPRPQTHAERSTRGSDHRPISMTLDFSRR